MAKRAGKASPWRKTRWKSTSLALLLAALLAGCDNGDETAVTDQEEAPAEAPADEVPAESDEASGEASLSEDEETLPGDEEPADEAPLVEEGAAEPSGEADAETLGEPPAELEEGEALPGETSSDEIEAIIEEQERRFEEASRRIDEQFEEAEQEAPLSEPPEEESTEFDAEAESGTGIDDDAMSEGEPTSSDIDAIIEEQERRFEEASRRLEEQFEALESEAPSLEPMEGGEPLELEPMEGDEADESAPMEDEAS